MFLEFKFYVNYFFTKYPFILYWFAGWLANVLVYSTIFSYSFFCFFLSAFFSFEIYAEEPLDKQLITPIPGLLDDFVDSCVDYFWFFMAMPYPCSPNYDSNAHLDAAVIATILHCDPEHVPEQVSWVYGAWDLESEINFASVHDTYADPDCTSSPVYLWVGYEKIPFSLEKSPDFFNYHTTYQPGRPFAVLLDFSDYMLGRPRCFREWVELAGFAFATFCGGKALESWCIEKGYFYLFFAYH